MTSLDELSAASPETNFWFFNSTVFTNPLITFHALVLNIVTCDETTSPLSFASKKVSMIANLNFDEKGCLYSSVW